MSAKRETDFNYLRGALSWQVFMAYQDERAKIDDLGIDQSRKDYITKRMDADFRRALASSSSVGEGVNLVRFSSALTVLASRYSCRSENTAGEVIPSCLLSGLALTFLHDLGSKDPGYSAAVA